MNETTRRNVLKASGAGAGATLFGVGSVQGGGSEGEGDGQSGSEGESDPLTDTSPGLVGTWTASPVPPVPSPEDGRSARGFDDETIRMIVRTSVGGSGLRVRLANTFGEDVLRVGHVEIGLQDDGAAVVPGSNRRVTFGDLDSVFVPPGAKVYSDPVDLDVEAETHLAVSVYLPGPTGPATHHPLGLTTSYIADNDNAAVSSDEEFETETTQWFYLEGIDVISPETNGAVVTLGNSITDGFGSTVDANTTYPSFLAERINESDAIQKSVLDAGISGNRVVSDPPLENAFGPNALARLDRDVIAQTGVTDVILLEGINDIGNAENVEGIGERVIWGMKQIVARVHARGLRIFGATLTPFERAEYPGYYSEEKEAERQAVNDWIRTSGAFDGVFDFDRALRDPEEPDRLLPKYDVGDALHPSDAGYRAMAEAVDLSALASESEGNEQSGEGEDSTGGLLRSPLAT